MSLEIISVCVAMLAGLFGIYKGTWSEKTNTPNKIGWATILVVISAGGLSLIQIANKASEEQRREARQARLSYQALIDVHAALAAFLGSMEPTRKQQFSEERIFPPPLRGDYYQNWHDDPNSLSAVVDRLSDPIVIPHGNGRTTRNHVTSFAARYRSLQRKLDETMAIYGPHVSDEVLDHLTELRNHSLFRRSKTIQDRTVVEAEQNDLRRCRGWIDDIALDLIELEGVAKGRCASKLRRTLRAMFSDPYPTPPFKEEMRETHEQHCLRIGVQVPNCAWSELI